MPLTHVCFWDSKVGYRPVSVEEADEMYPYETVPADNRSRFVCDLCAQNIGFTKPHKGTGTRHFYHSRGEQNKECEDRAQVFERIVLAFNSHTMPLRIKVHNFQMSFELGFFYPNATNVSLQGSYQIKIRGVLYGYTLLGTPWYPFEAAITTLILPEGLTGMGAYCFRGCTHIENVYFGGTKAQWEAVVENSDTFFDPLDELNAATFHYGADGIVTRRAFAVENLDFESGYDGMVAMFGLYDIPVTGVRDTTYEAVTESLSAAFADADEDDISYIYVSCHGYGDVGLKIATDAGIPYRVFKGLLDIIPGTKVIIMNSCRSGHLTNVFEYGEFQEVSPIPGTLYRSDYKVLVSSTNKEDTRGWLAPYAWCNGLGWDAKTQAECGMEADANNDNEITLEELYQYAPAIYWRDGGNEGYHHPVRWPVNDNTAIFVKPDNYVITMPGSGYCVIGGATNRDICQIDFTAKSGGVNAPLEAITVDAAFAGSFAGNSNADSLPSVSAPVVSGDGFRITVQVDHSCVVKVTVKCGNSSGDYFVIVPGDVNASGSITSSDATQMLSVISGAVEMPEGLAAGNYAYELMDLDGNGRISISDVTIVLRMASGMITAN